MPEDRTNTTLDGFNVSAYRPAIARNPRNQADHDIMDGRLHGPFDSVDEFLAALDGPCPTRDGFPHNAIAHPLLVLAPRLGRWLHAHTEPIVPTWRTRWSHTLDRVVPPSAITDWIHW